MTCSGPGSGVGSNGFSESENGLFQSKFNCGAIPNGLGKGKRRAIAMTRQSPENGRRRVGQQ